MTDKDKLALLKTMASLPEEDQRSLAFFVAGLVAGKSNEAISVPTENTKSVDTH